MNGEAQLFQVVGTLGPSRCLASSLDRGQQQRNQYRDDGNDDQELDEREASMRSRRSHAISPFGFATLEIDDSTRLDPRFSQRARATEIGFRPKRRLRHRVHLPLKPTEREWSES